MGNWKTIFYIGLGGFIGLSPFVYKEIPGLFSEKSNIKLLLLLSTVSLLSALLLFEALKRGKLSIIEPVFGLELPTVIILSIVIAHEELDATFYLLSALVFAGLVLAVTKWEHFNLKKHWLEKGVMLAVFGSLIMGLVDLLAGLSSRTTSPLLAIWFLHSFLGLLAFIYLLSTRNSKNLFKDILKFPQNILSLMFFDNFAWVCYGYSMLYLPIAIATTISESFIALAALLGIYINREKLQKHQFFGIGIVVTAVLILAYLVEY